MGLKKSRTVAGFTAEYWNISNISWNKKNNKFVVTLVNYKDKATRDENTDNIFDGSAILHVELTQQELSDILTVLYTKVVSTNSSIDFESEEVNGQIVSIPFFRNAIEE